MEERPEHVSKTEARQGTTPHMARYALVWGTGLVVLAFLVILLIYWFW